MARIAADLQRALSGYVLPPGDPRYVEQTQIDNGRIQLLPALIVMVDSVADVVKTMKFARQHRLKITAKAGGHSATGYCLNSGGLVIDFSLMKAIRLEGDTLRVQAGTRWIDIYNYLGDKGNGLIPVGGGCAPVGVSGFVLGGGYSFASRSYGLSIDNLIALTIVDADGNVRVISEDSSDRTDIDLFWACRGGGGGNFGIVVDLHLQLRKPRSETMLVSQIRYRSDHAQDVIGFYNDWVETLPNELACYGIWGPYTDPASSKIISAFGFTCVYNGDAAEGMDLLNPLFKRDPFFAQINNMTLPQFETMVGRNTLVGGRYAYIRSGEVPPRGLTMDFIATLDRFMSSAPSLDTFMVWTHAGGAIDEVTKDATAFAHRGARFMPEVKAVWPRNDVGQTRANVEWAHDFFEQLRPHFSGAYVNYIDALQSDWKRMYYGDNYARLRSIKEQVDPDGIFTFQQGIASDFEPDMTKPLDLAPLNRTFVE
ncbi:MAG TPA: FAD-binding oxidoreductase [Allosphingosinicella sp.]